MWGAGFATGIGVGFAIGLIVGRLGVKEKSWSELSDRERKLRIWLITLGAVALAVGIVVFLLAIG